MNYGNEAIAEPAIPRAQNALFQHLVDTYASETNKTYSTWACFRDDDLAWRPHPRSATVGDILKHHLLSERRFFGEFLDSPEPLAGEVLPAAESIESYRDRLSNLARPRLEFLAGRSAEWWQMRVPFFDVEREHIWIFWRRVLHSAHHRTQLTVYLRLLDCPVPPIYGPTADATWSGADPTRTVEAASRK